MDRLASFIRHFKLELLDAFFKPLDVLLVNTEHVVSVEHSELDQPLVERFLHGWPAAIEAKIDE